MGLMNEQTPIVSVEDIRAAYQRIRRHIRRTPVMVVDGVEFGHDTAVNLKLELLQHAGSFKPRGAFNNLLARDVPAAGVAAASGGNHGAAVAYAANRLGHAANIFVPEISSPAKIGKIRNAGAVTHIEGARYADALARCERFQQTSGAIGVHAYAEPMTIAGQGTLALEWAEQAPDIDTVLVAVGGAGLISGMAAFYRDSVKIVGVEPEGSCALNAALAAGSPVEVEVNSLAADSLGARSVGALNHAICARFVDHVALVSDDAIRRAMALLWTRFQIVAEPGGAAALAALISGAYRPAKGERLGVLVCGGNVDLSLVKEIAE